MREIKFRAWDKKKERMTNDFFIISDGTIFKSSYCNNPKKINNYIIMQYTGLKDKNGVEIYEGDIVKRYNRDDKIHTCSVVWNGNNFTWGLKSINLNIQLIADFYKTSEIELEVIGNIYENKELLK